MTDDEPQDSTRLLALLVGLALLAYGAIAFTLTEFVLVDDAYITLRYAYNWAHHGLFFYNLDENVFGVTTPLYAVWCTALELVPFSIEHLTLGVNWILYCTAVAVAGGMVRSSSRPAFFALLLFAPPFVDNLMLGMETPLFMLLAALASRAFAKERYVPAALALGLLLVTRPEGALWAAVLFVASFFAAQRPRVGIWFIALIPLALWAIVGETFYQSAIPQSVIAKSGWMADRYETAWDVEALVRTFGNLTLFPYGDDLPAAARPWVQGAQGLFVLLVLAANFARGTTYSRMHCGFYCLYVVFFLAGKGASEASWYAIPSSFSLLVAAEVLFPARLSNVVPVVFVIALGSASIFALRIRGERLQSYMDSYGAAAEYLELYDERDDKPAVVIGEIGVFGYYSSHPIVDVAALVSPAVMDMKNEGTSFVEIVRATGAGYFVLSRQSVEENTYPGVGDVWSDAGERSWFESSTQLGAFGERLLYQVP